VEYIAIFLLVFFGFILALLFTGIELYIKSKLGVGEHLGRKVA